MKKFLTFLICAFAISAFAEPFVRQNYAKLWKQNAANARKYAYQSQVSKQSNYQHVIGHLLYFKQVLGKNITQQQIQQQSKKFVGTISDVIIWDMKGQAACQYGLFDYAVNCYYNCKSYTLVDRLKNKGGLKFIIQKNLYWQVAQITLLENGGLGNAKDANMLLSNAFRYKSKNVSKEQQIEFLKQLSQIYPIPGTDFNQWKGFMGFVGFKYKQLTGKELF